MELVRTDGRSRVVLPGHADEMFLMRENPDGSILLVEPHYHRVNRFGPDGTLLARWGRHGTNQGDFWFPRAVAAGPDGSSTTR